MVNFTHQRKFVTRESRVTVNAGLAPGIHVFELVVMDQAGNCSQPARIRVEIICSPFTGPFIYMKEGLVNF